MYPKTPRTKAAALAPSTGHVDSPLTLVIGKKTQPLKMKTPKQLPKKGRKSIVKVWQVKAKIIIIWKAQDEPQ